MSVRTARKYERAGKLPSQLKQPRTHRTRPNPFEADWPWVAAQLERDPALQHHIAAWRAQSGPARDVIFEQVHLPGRMGQSDFTHMEDLRITLAGLPFAHLLYHFALTFSNAEAVAICFSESFEALAEGVEACLWQLGGVPMQHRTDNLSAAVVTIAAADERVYTERYGSLMAHYHMQPSTNQPGNTSRRTRRQPKAG